MVQCPRCKSDKAKFVNYIGIKCILCSKCGYDGSSIYDVYPEEKKSQKAKGSYSPYKAGRSIGK